MSTFDIAKHKEAARAQVALQLDQSIKAPVNEPDSPTERTALAHDGDWQVMRSLTDKSPMCDVREANLHAMSEFVKLVRDPNWKFETIENNIRIYKNKCPGNAPFAAFMGVGDLAVPPMAAVDLISQSEHKSEYDEIFDSARVLHRYDATSQVEEWRYWTPSRLIVSARDFTLLASAGVLGDGSLCMTAKSIEFNHSNKALDGNVKKGFLRANAITGGFLIVPLPDNVLPTDEHSSPLDQFLALQHTVITREQMLSARRCRILYLAQVDLKGTLPKQLQSTLFQRQPQQIHGMRRLLEKESFDHKAKQYEKLLDDTPHYDNIKLL